MRLPSCQIAATHLAVGGARQAVDKDDFSAGSGVFSHDGPLGKKDAVFQK